MSKLSVVIVGMMVSWVQAAGVPCATLKDSWNGIKQDFGADFSLDNNCAGISGRFAESAYLLKEHFPTYYKEVDANIQRTVLGGPSDIWAAEANRLTKTMKLYAGFFEAKAIEFSIVSLVHESAHMDARTPWHKRCRRGRNAGKPELLCDENISGDLADGSYAYEYGFLVEMGFYNLKHGVFSYSAIADRLEDNVDNHFNVVPESTLEKSRKLIFELRELSFRPGDRKGAAAGQPAVEERPILNTSPPPLSDRQRLSQMVKEGSGGPTCMMAWRKETGVFQLRHEDKQQEGKNCMNSVNAKLSGCTVKLDTLYAHKFWLKCTGNTSTDDVKRADACVDYAKKRACSEFDQNT